METEEKDKIDESPPEPMEIDEPSPTKSANSGASSLNEEVNIIKEEIIELDNPKISAADDESLESFESNQKKNEENALKTLVTFQDKRIHEFVKKEIENAILIENIGTEMTYSISNKAEYTKNYEHFFHQIESNMNYLGKIKNLYN